MSDLLEELQKAKQAKLEFEAKRLEKTDEELLKEANYYKNKVEIDATLIEVKNYLNEVANLIEHKLETYILNPFTLECLCFDAIYSLEQTLSRKITFYFQDKEVIVYFLENPDYSDTKKGELRLNINQLTKDVYEEWIKWLIKLRPPPIPLKSDLQRKEAKFFKIAGSIFVLIISFIFFMFYITK